MTVRFVYRCRECDNAIVGGMQPVTTHECPACHTNADRYQDDNNTRLFSREGQIR